MDLTLPAGPWAQERQVGSPREKTRRWVSTSQSTSRQVGPASWGLPRNPSLGSQDEQRNQRSSNQKSVPQAVSSLPSLPSFLVRWAGLTEEITAVPFVIRVGTSEPFSRGPDACISRGPCLVDDRTSAADSDGDPSHSPAPPSVSQRSHPPSTVGLSRQRRHPSGRLTIG